MAASSDPTSEIGVFLAHALALELDAAQRYGCLADAAEQHRSAEIVALFRDLGYHSHRHAADVRELGKQHGGIPEIPSWQFAWYDPTAQAPEAVAQPGDVQALTLQAALQMALQAEQHAHAYYAAVASDTNDPEIARLAQEFAKEEAEHVTLVESWLERTEP